MKNCLISNYVVVILKYVIFSNVTQRGSRNGKIVLKLFTTFIVVAAILASPKHRCLTGLSLPGVIVPVFIVTGNKQ